LTPDGRSNVVRVIAACQQDDPHGIEGVMHEDWLQQLRDVEHHLVEIYSGCGILVGYVVVGRKVSLAAAVVGVVKHTHVSLLLNQRYASGKVIVVFIFTV
jgi:hypothetical protein